MVMKADAVPCEEMRGGNALDAIFRGLMTHAEGAVFYECKWHEL